MNVERFLRWYQKHGNKLIGEEKLEGLGLSELQALFGEPADEPMYACYRVSPFQVARLQEAVKNHIDLVSHDYFVEANAV